SASTPSRATTTGLRMWFFLNARRVRATSSGLSSTSKIVRRSIDPPSLQREEKRGSLSDGSFGPDPSTVAVDDTLHHGQADAVSLELVGVVQPLERLKQFILVRRVEAGAVVAHEESVPPFHQTGTEFNAGVRLPGGVFPGVAQQIIQHHAQEVGIAVRR